MFIFVALTTTNSILIVNVDYLQGGQIVVLKWKTYENPKQRKMYNLILEEHWEITQTSKRTSSNISSQRLVVCVHSIDLILQI